MNDFPNNFQYREYIQHHVRGKKLQESIGFDRNLYKKRIMITTRVSNLLFKMDTFNHKLEPVVILFYLILKIFKKLELKGYSKNQETSDPGV